MKKRKFIYALAATSTLLLLGAASTSKSVKADTTDTINIYRMYNPNSGEHFYTSTKFERNSLVDSGWDYEGIGWTESATQGKDVYRLYNPNAGDHYYTESAYERDSLVTSGWNYEGVVFKQSGSNPVFVAYNPNAVTGAHNFTTSLNEQNHLLSVGWTYGATAWKATGTGVGVSPLTTMNLLGNAADPSVYYDNGTYYLYNSYMEGKHIQLSTSKDGLHFTKGGDALAYMPSGYSDGVAASKPFVTKINGKYIMYLHYWTGDRTVIGTATANSAAGPFVPSSQALLTPSDNSYDIYDAFVFSSNGNNFLFYATQRSAGRGNWVVQLSSDGMSVVGTPTPLLDSSQVKDFYTGVATSRIEAPSVTQSPDGTYVMFYGANDADNDNGYTGYATSDSIAGPYTDHGAILRTLNTGTGGPDEMQLFTQNGATRMYFNGWDAPHNSWVSSNGHGRSVYSKDFHWVNGHTPVMNANLD